ncbi:MAG: bifunctional oligoribonuclease/PAP phosphatase NrnA [Ruminiclostridium sp.]|nr:bifunctional oligoribonuclease/PAP phosphatase NrnA [Ruminiclostridium sp.]
MTIPETASRILELDNILILTHRRPDGDTIGCAAALCLALRQKGKTAHVLFNEDAHGLFDPYFEGVLSPADFRYEAVVAVDTAAPGMLPDSAAFLKDRVDLCIDHHGSNEHYAKATCLDADAAACGEIIYKLLLELGVALTDRMAMLLYMAVATDTGCFVYSNTTPETHRIAANLMEHGFDTQWVNKRHFRVKSLKRMQIESRLVQEMDLEQDGTLVFAYVTLDLIRELEATEEDLEDISSFIGLLEGVDNAVTLRQLAPDSCKISLRTDGKSLNASAVCAHFGGGGHPAAAGCTIQGTPAQAKAAMLDAIRQVQHG